MLSLASCLCHQDSAFFLCQRRPLATVRFSESLHSHGIRRVEQARYLGDVALDLVFLDLSICILLAQWSEYP